MSHFAERLKKEAVESLGAATSVAMDSLNGGVAIVWHNQQQLEAEAKQLLQNSQRLAKQTEQWCNTFAAFNQSLKALGDVENWVAVIDMEMRFLAVSLEKIGTTDPSAGSVGPASSVSKVAGGSTSRSSARTTTSSNIKYSE